jgi:hypothetical protein
MDAAEIPPNLDGFTEALVRRKLPGSEKHGSGIEPGTEVFQGPWAPRHRAVFRQHRLNGCARGGGRAPDRVHTIG